MDKKTLYEKAEKALNQAFDAARVSVKVLSEKAGEAAHVTKLLVEKAALEHRVSRKFAQLGSRLYEKAIREKTVVSLSDPEIKSLIEETTKLDVELAQIEASLVDEQKRKQSQAQG